MSNVEHCFLDGTATIGESLISHPAFTMLSRLLNDHVRSVASGHNAVADLECLNELAGMIDLKLDQSAGAEGDGTEPATC